MTLRLPFLGALLLAALVLLPLVAQGQQDIEEHRSCAVCGMDRKAYGYSRMLIRFQDGGQIGVCSLHCAVSELDAHKDRPAASILVADRETRELVDAEKAFWVLGGKKRGVMTMVPTWAFDSEASARGFCSTHGGALASWAEVQATARKEILESQ
jgi:nitrous oxide reductase accessory protein NosL